MVTREQLLQVCGDDATPYRNHNIDHVFELVKLLRERIPYDECKQIIGNVGHELIYLPDVELVLKHLNENDLLILEECNTSINCEFDCLYLFI